MICACVLTIFEFNLRSSSWSTLIFAPWLILMHNYMYMAFIPNPFNILLASPMEQTFLYNLMSLFLHRNCHSLSSLNAYIDVDGFHPPIHPIFFMHCKWNFPSNVYLSANISPLGLSFNYQNHTWGLHVLSVITHYVTILMPILSYFTRFTWRGRMPAAGILGWKRSKY